MMKKNTKSVAEKITAIAEKWFVLDPLYFLIWMTHEAVPNPAITTIRVGNGRIEYNPIFLQSLSLKEVEEILKAEVLRILLKHPYSRRKEQITTAYLASNITIKEHSTTKLPFPTAQEIFQTKAHDKKHFEWYYEKLLQQGLSRQSSLSDGQRSGSPPSNTTESNDSSTTDTTSSHTPTKAESTVKNYSHSTSIAQENTTLWGENEWINQQINDKIETALQSQSWGTIPNMLQELILAAMRPKLDYRKILRAFRQSVLSSTRTLTRMKPSRRYGFQYMGSRRDFSTKMLFALDVSGSVSSKDLQKGLAVLNQFFRYGIAAIDVIFFDTLIKSKALSLKKAQQSLTITGRGGTNFQPVIDYLGEHKDYDGLIIFTDGYAPVPMRTSRYRTRLFWLFQSEENYQANFEGLSKLGRGGFLE